jgi:hypothetical protein
MEVSGQLPDCAALPLLQDSTVSILPRGWMGSRAGLDAMKTRKEPFPYRKSSHYSTVVHFVEELRCKPEACVSIPVGLIRDFH